MAENYKFVQNLKCEYFPCHRVENEETFNCLFLFLSALHVKKVSVVVITNILAMLKIVATV